MTIKLALPIAAVILTACAVTADALIVDRLSGCAVHNPNPKSGESITWSGECANGAAHGLGTASWFLDGKPNGQFEGDLLNGRIIVTGSARYPSGNRYSGTFRRGVPHGEGTFFFKDGRRLTEDWIDGKLDGRVIMTGRLVDRVIDTNDEGRNHRARCRGPVGVLFPREQGHERHDT